MTSEAEAKRQSLIEHLTELRTCLIRSLISLAGGMILSLFFAKEIFSILQRPLLRVMPAGSGFITTSPLEAVITYLKVSLLTGVFLGSPFVLYQVWRFVAPGLYKKERTLTVLLITASTLLFVGGALFGYFFIFPVGFKFFVTTLEGTGIQFLPQMSDYLGFISKMLLTFGAIFEMPLILTALTTTGIVQRKALAKARRYVLVIIFLVAGILTPGPDVISQFLLAIPLLGLYELSLLLAWFLEKTRKKI